MLELDVHLTKDGVCVVSHDQDLFRVTGKQVRIKECDFQDLPMIQIWPISGQENMCQPIKGSWIGRSNYVDGNTL